MPEINILGNPLIIFFIAVFVVAVIAFFLSFLEIKLRKNLKHKVEEEYQNTRQISLLKNQQIKPEIRLNMINNKARKVFHEIFKINSKEEYTYLVKEFKKRKKPEAVLFCQKMIEALYEGNPPTNEKMNWFVAQLEKIVDKETAKIEEKDMIKIHGNKITKVDEKNYAPERKYIIRTPLTNFLRELGYKIKVMFEKREKYQSSEELKKITLKIPKESKVVREFREGLKKPFNTKLLTSKENQETNPEMIGIDERIKRNHQEYGIIHKIDDRERIKEILRHNKRLTRF